MFTNVYIPSQNLIIIKVDFHFKNHHKSREYGEGGGSLQLFSPYKIIFLKSSFISFALFPKIYGHAPIVA